jgi:hypothetical protein
VKAIFEILPHFKTIIDISERQQEYYFALMEDGNLFFKGVYDDYVTGARPAPIKILVFRFWNYESLCIGKDLVYLPKYIFSRIKD